MSLLSNQAFTYRLICNNQQLDTFSDEDIHLSNNITGLFDLGILPSSFTREITLPGTKVNNAFFEHVYDISIDSPFLFATNIKVPAYMEFDSVFLVNGYLQLNKVNVRANKFIESYNVTIYGTLSSFGRDINRFYLNDLASLSEYNHTASYQNITDSWSGNLFYGDIVYPLADYGTGWSYTSGNDFFGIDDIDGGINIMDYKPAIRVKKVVDAIFSEAGYTYSSSFMDSDWFNNIYMVCNNQLKYPVYSELNLESYGKVKFGAVSGSGMTDLNLPVSASVTQLPWFNVLSDPSLKMGTSGSYSVETVSTLRGVINLNLNISCSVNNVPEEIRLQYWPTGSSPGGIGAGSIPLTSINEYFREFYLSRTGSLDQTFELSTKISTTTLLPYYYYFGLSIEAYNAISPTITLDPKGSTRSFLEITKVNYAGDDKVMDIPLNMPKGTVGIKQIDFITGLQKKFNLVIYPSKSKPSEFIVEPFNTWYNKGRVWDFNQYINLDDSIEVIPANNLAVNELNFGDTLDGDYISQQFSKENNREFGKTYYVDTQNFYSQGKFNVETTFSSTPLTRMAGTGISGSVAGLNPGPVVSYAYYAGNAGFPTNNQACLNTTYFPNTLWADTDIEDSVTRLFYDYNRTIPFNGNYSYWKIQPQLSGTQYSFFIAYDGQVFSVTPC